jgi:signal transduction histidine kinase
MSALLDDLGVFARGEAPPPPQPARVSLQSSLEDVVSQLRPAAEARNIRLVVEAAPLSALTEERRLRQILMNLVSNAIKYNRADGWVRIQCSAPQAGVVRLEISDSGPGIPASLMARVFEPFVRLRTDVAGSGLGLTIAKELVEAMGGKIGLSANPPAGTTMWFELPAAVSAG